MFINLGIEAVAPVILDDFGYQHSKQAGICSNWSERHTAYAAGMGTFGLSDGFITEKRESNQDRFADNQLQAATRYQKISNPYRKLPVLCQRKMRSLYQKMSCGCNYFKRARQTTLL